MITATISEACGVCDLINNCKHEHKQRSNSPSEMCELSGTTENLPLNIQKLQLASNIRKWWCGWMSSRKRRRSNDHRERISRRPKSCYRRKMFADYSEFVTRETLSLHWHEEMMSDVISRDELIALAANQNHCLQKIKHFEHEEPPSNVCNLKRERFELFSSLFGNLAAHNHRNAFRRTVDGLASAKNRKCQLYKACVAARFNHLQLYVVIQPNVADR